MIIFFINMSLFPNTLPHLQGLSPVVIVLFSFLFWGVRWIVISFCLSFFIFNFWSTLSFYFFFFFWLWVFPFGLSLSELFYWSANMWFINASALWVQMLAYSFFLFTFWFGLGGTDSSPSQIVPKELQNLGHCL